MRCLNPLTLKNPAYDGRDITQKFLKVPCGKCTACLSNKRRQWCFRLENEVANSTSAYFITLTYNEQNCPEYVNKKHCQDFLKRFRKRVDFRGLRYFLVSEYGETFGRPHYHLLLFNYPHTMEHLRRDLAATWQMCDKEMFEYGDVVAPVSPAAINYCCKYCLATCTSDNPRDRTFMLCSRRPGIGSTYLTPAMVDYLRSREDGVTIYNGLPILLPRYYDSKVFCDDELKARKMDLRRTHSELDRSSFMKMSPQEYMNYNYLIECGKQDYDKKIKSTLKNGKNQR